MLTARGVIEYCEDTFSSNMPTKGHGQKNTHKNKWIWIYKKNPEFVKKVETHLGSKFSADDVANLASQVYSKASTIIHSSNTLRGVEINKNYYNSEERRFLRAVCAFLPCTLTEI